MTGKRNAAKKSCEKTAVERVSLFVPIGWKEEAKREAQKHGMSLCAWIRHRCDL